MLWLTLQQSVDSYLSPLLNNHSYARNHTLSLHDALPICGGVRHRTKSLRHSSRHLQLESARVLDRRPAIPDDAVNQLRRDRKSTRLNSSHLVISYAVFCLKKKRYEIMSHVPEPSVRFTPV